MRKQHKFTVSAENAGRLDRSLALALPDYSRTFLQNLIKNGSVCVNAAVITQPRFAVTAGMDVAVTLAFCKRKVFRIAFAVFTLGDGFIVGVAAVNMGPAPSEVGCGVFIKTQGRRSP